MKTLLINIMGTSPMVATEMYSYLKNENISDVLLITTKNENVMAGAFAVKESLEYKYKAHVHLLALNIDDITNDNDVIYFIKEISIQIKKEINNYGIGKIIVNVSGGRKIQTIVFSLYASLFNIDEVYNIINKNVQNYNENYEKIKCKIMEFNENNSHELYQKYKEEIDHIFYPDMNLLYFLKVPVIRFTRQEINKIKQVLNSNFIEDAQIYEDELKVYENSGFITYDRSRIYKTELGQIISDYLE